MDYCIGDRVRAKYNTLDLNQNIKTGMVGTVVDIIDGISIGIAFDEPISGHCCGDENICPHGHGWYIYNPERDLELVENEVISSVPEDELLGFLS